MVIVVLRSCIVLETFIVNRLFADDVLLFDSGLNLTPVLRKVVGLTE